MKMKVLALTSGILLLSQINMVVALEVPPNYKEISSLPSKCEDSFFIKGGQGLIVDVKNSNILGVTFAVSTNLNGEQSAIILPGSTHRFKFTIFGEEPMTWHIKTGTSSDACAVNLSIYSTWKEGDPLNR